MSDKYPVTQAVRELKKAGIAFTPHLYEYQEKGGTAVSSAALNVDEHRVIKTLVMENDARAPLIVLMHGDCQVSTKQLARVLSVKTISPCAPDVAEKHTGYQVGGTSPFGTKKKMPVYVEKSIFELDKILINGGKRGFLVAIDPAALRRLLPVTEVEVAIRD